MYLRRLSLLNYMKITKHTVPSVTYTLKVEGEIVDQAEKSNPLTFLVGVGAMIPGFERQLVGLSKGDNYQFTVQAEEGYGEIDEKAIVDLSKDAFKVDGAIQNEMLFVGNVVQMQDQNGNPFEGTILEIGDETVKLDFNHKLAGKVLDFSGEVIDVREATEEEISHGHVHGPGGHHH